MFVTASSLATVSDPAGSSGCTACRFVMIGKIVALRIVTANRTERRRFEANFASNHPLFADSVAIAIYGR